MKRIIVLNETGYESYSREYNTFISALCLARMGHEVLYVGNTRFAPEFYAGGHVRDVDVFDMLPPKKPAMLPVGFEMVAVERLDIKMITAAWLREKMLRFGKPDVIFYSGGEYMPTFAGQVAGENRCLLLPLDFWNNEPPCVNEIQLLRSEAVTHPPVNRVVAIAEYMWMDHEVTRIRDLCSNMGNYELWLIAKQPKACKPVPQEALHANKIYWQPPMSDGGRFKILRSASMYIEPSKMLCKQGIAEALCAGVPVICEDSDVARRLFGSLVNYIGERSLDSTWFDAGRKHENRNLTQRARHAYGFAGRIAFLHNLLQVWSIDDGRK